MYELYCNIYTFGSWKLELCERYTSLSQAIDATVAMWPENDRPVPMFISLEGNLLATFTPFGENGQNVIVKVLNEIGTGDWYTDFVYEYAGDRIVATKCRKNGDPCRIDHNSY